MFDIRNKNNSQILGVIFLLLNSIYLFGFKNSGISNKPPVEGSGLFKG